jgi:nucleoside-diphosphate-sugar epimerase
MKILVTGGTGFVGSHAVEALCRAGNDVRLMARSREKVDHLLATRAIGAADVALCDMTDAAAVHKALAGCDAVLHAAASVAIGRTRGVFASNVAGNHNVVGQAVELGLDPVIYVSSVASLFPPSGPTLGIDEPVGSLRTAYGRSKAECETYVRGLQARGAPVVSIYPSGVYGPDDPGPGPTLKGLRDRIKYAWIMTSGGTATVDVRDLARVITAALAPGRGPRRYMAGGHFLTWAQEADLCQEILGRSVRRVPVPRWLVRTTGRAVDVLNWICPPCDFQLTYEASLFVTEMVPCDDQHTHEDLGIAFRPIRETLADSIRWLISIGEVPAELAPALRDERARAE